MPKLDVGAGYDGLWISQSAELFLYINKSKIAHKICLNISKNSEGQLYLIGAQKKNKISKKNTIFTISMSQHGHQQQHRRMKTFCNPGLSNVLTHPPFACSWFWSPTLASIPPTPMCLNPLLMLFFFRFPFSQPNACPREPPAFFCPRWVLASRAKISEMSLGTRSPVDLLRDILEDVGATPQPRWVCPLLGKMLTSAGVCILPVRQHPGPEGWVREKMRWKNESNEN